MDKKPSPERITVIIRDQLGSPYAIVAITRDVVLEATYITNTGILQLVLSSTHTEGQSTLEWTEKMSARKQDSELIQKPMGSYRQDMYYQLQGQHNMLNIGDEDEIRKVWTFLECDRTVDELFAMREEALKTLAEFKKKKEEEAQEKLKKALAEKNDADREKEKTGTIKPLSDDEKKLLTALKSGKAGTPVKEK